MTVTMDQTNIIVLPAWLARNGRTSVTMDGVLTQVTNVTDEMTAEMDLMSATVDPYVTP